MNHAIRNSEDSGAEARLAARLAGALTLASQDLPHGVDERLRVAREQVLERARTARAARVLAAVSVSGAGALSLGGFGAGWRKAASALPLILLLAGFIAIDHWLTREQVLAAAEIDAQLLSGDLPPTAYSDPGFAEFLRGTPPP